MIIISLYNIKNNYIDIKANLVLHYGIVKQRCREQ